MASSRWPEIEEMTRNAAGRSSIAPGQRSSAWA
jgi:hypothetical protein